jgi:O-antigen biosynthesis protein
VLSRWLAKLGKRALGAPTKGSEATYTVSMPEITPYTPTPAQGSALRLNIILPSINASHYFGGIHTAVLLYRELCAHFPRSRVILSDAAPELGALARLPDHVLGHAHMPATAAREVVAYSDRYLKPLCVEPGDFWLCTAWWTAYAAQRLQAWQAKELGVRGDLLYLIQDFEPGFYPWSSNHIAALSTYRPEQDFAIFNTGLLADYFDQQGLSFRRRTVFEPTLNQGLRPSLPAAASGEPRERRIVIYGRPSTPRNAFELICEALRLWRWRFPNAAAWTIVSPGELMQDLDIGGVQVHGLGKLVMGAYADLLATSSVGLSLMVSPHPSYPPLEMAAFGMRVITNGYANKDLSRLSSNIHSVAPTPEAIADALARSCTEAEQGGMRALPVVQPGSAFLDEGSFAQLAARVAGEIMAAQVAR